VNEGYINATGCLKTILRTEYIYPEKINEDNNLSTEKSTHNHSEHYYQYHE
jgi:hypothetical protein